MTYFQNHNAPTSFIDAPVLGPQYRVSSLEEVDRTFRVGMQCIQLPSACPYCSGKTLKLWGRRWQIFADLPRRSRPVQLVVEVKRYRCGAPNCLKTFMQELPGMADNRAMTQRLRRWVYEQALYRTNVSIAQEVGLDEKTVRAVFADQVEKMRGQVRPLASACMAIVPITALNAPRYALLNTTHGLLAELIEKRGADALTACLKSFDNLDAVTRVGIGFDRCALCAVQENLPGAKPFIDPLAVFEVLQRCLESVYVALRAKLALYERRCLADTLQLLHTQLASLATSSHKHKQTDLERYPALSEAQTFITAVMNLYSTVADAKEASASIDAALSSLSPQVKHHFDEFAAQWKAWKFCIVNAFDHSDDMKFVWGLTSTQELSEIVDRGGRGSSIHAVRARLIFPPSIPAFSMSSRGISIVRLRSQILG